MKKFVILSFTLILLITGCGREKEEKSITRKKPVDQKIFPPLDQPLHGPGGSNYIFTTVETPKARYMGIWSDGTSVKEPIIKK